MATPQQQQWLADTFGLNPQMFASSDAAAGSVAMNGANANASSPPAPGGADPIAALITEIDGDLKQIEAAVPGIPEEAVRDPIVSQLGVLQKRRAAGVKAKAATREDVLKKIRDDVKDLLHADLAVAQAQVATDEKRQAAITREEEQIDKTLEEARVAIQHIKDQIKSAPLKKELNRLYQERNKLGGLKDATLMGSLAKLGPQSLKLLEEAETLSLKQLASEPDGAAQIDGMVAAMGDNTSDLQSAAVCKAAVCARYRIDFKEPNLGTTKRLPRLYKLLGEVPPAHTVHNPKLKHLTYKTDPTAAGDADYGDETIDINRLEESDAGFENNYVGPDGKPLSPAPAKLDALTLHEIGHAVDEKQSYMDDHYEDSKHGGWREEKFDDVVKAHGDQGFYAHFLGKGTKQSTQAAKYDDLKALLEHCLQNGKPPDRPKDAHAKFGALFDAWDQIVVHKAVKSCLAIGVDQSPWYKADPAAIAVGKRVYQEAYPDQWVSYELAARGGSFVSKYQWRHYYEWFAETYTMYYMKKLSPSHFMYAWFEKQKPPAKK